MPRPPDPACLPAVRDALTQPQPPAEHARHLARVAGGAEALHQALDALAARGELRLSPALALELALLSPYPRLGEVARLTSPLGESARPALLAAAQAALAQPYLDPLRALVLTLCLGPAAPEPLRVEALRAAEPGPEGRPVVLALRALLRALPEAERERAVFAEAAPDPLARGHLLWAFAGVCPTPRVAQACVEQALAWTRTEFARAPLRRELAEEALAELGGAAVPALAEGLATGAGRAAPQRELLVRALAAARDARGAEALAGLLGDKLEGVREAARGALLALGPAARPGLEAVAANPKAKGRSGAAAVLKEMGGTGAKAVPVSPTSPTSPRSPTSETSATSATSATSGRQVHLAPPPPGLSVLTSLRATLGPAERASLLARFDPAQHEAAEVQRLALEAARADVRALVAAADRYLLALAQGQAWADGLDLPFFARACAAAREAHPAVPWLAAELLCTCPARGPYQLKKVLPAFARELGPALDAPLAQLLASGRARAERPLLEHLAGRGPEALPALLHGAASADKALRALSAAALARLGPAALPGARGLLASDAGARLVAAEVLRAVPDPASLPALEAALAREEDPAVRALLEGARAACRLTGDSPRALDAALARSASGELPDGLPALRWRTGAKLSAKAYRGLWAALQAEGEGPPDATLARARAQLDDADCAALAEAVARLAPLDGAHRWSLYARALLGAEAQVEALGASLGELAHHHRAQLASHAVEALRRRPLPPALRWLDHWALQGTARLRRDAATALADLARTRGLSRDDLVEGAAPTLGFDDAGRRPLGKLTAELGPGNALRWRGARGREVPADQAGPEGQALARAVASETAWLRARLEAAMVVGRTWSAQRWQALFLGHALARSLARGLVFRGAAGLFALGAEGPVDLSGRPVKPHGGASQPGPGEVALPHPVLLTDAEREAWARALASWSLAPPFLQLGRPFERAPTEALARLLPQARLPARELQGGLERLGYRRGEPQEAGIIFDAARPVGGWELVLVHDGIAASDGRGVHGEAVRVLELRLQASEGQGGPPPESLRSEAVVELRELLEHRPARAG